MMDVILDSFHDSLKAFVFIFVIYIILSFFEIKIINALKKGKKYNPFFGSLIGIVPQCGVSVVAGDLYVKRHISMGTLIAIFLACSDEALVVLLGSERAIMAIPLIISKLIIGSIVGFLVDLVINKNEVKKHIEECDECNIGEVKCCCNHCLNEDDEITKFDIYIWHPFIHSLKLTVAIFVLNIIFGLVFVIIGETNIIAFLDFNKYISPLFAILVGLIPSCVSSVILTELFITHAISFGTFLSGLLVNAGLGLMMIFKRKGKLKENSTIIFILVISALVSGYLTCLILGF